MKSQIDVAPGFFNPVNAALHGYNYKQDVVLDEARAWVSRFDITPNRMDAFRIAGLGIDLQRDFCFPEGSLYVAGRSGTGAIDDNNRISRFIYRELPNITDIILTFDTHRAFQIFSPWFWVASDGSPLLPHTLVVISSDGHRLQNTDLLGTVLHDDVRPNPALAWMTNNCYPDLRKQAFYYCSELARIGKYTLYLWPSHCILGDIGHTLAGVIQEARMFHAYCRFTDSASEPKGNDFLSERYSVFSAEVPNWFNGGVHAQRNNALFDRLFGYDAVFVFGQAGSHCVGFSLDDLRDEIIVRRKQPELANKFYIMMDCMSPVTVPDGGGGFAVDFTDQQNAMLAKCEEAGMHVVRSTDAIASWPGLRDRS